MRKFKKLVIGGIESKIVVLLLIDILLVAAVFVGGILAQSRMLSSLTEETTERQLSSVTGITASVIDTVIEQNMDRITDLKAQATDEMFRELAIRVRMVGDSARKLLEEADSSPRVPWARPDASKDGELFVKVLLADEVEEAAVADELGVIANLTDTMQYVCTAYGADNVWFSLPDGVTLMADTVPGQWVNEDGTYVSYNAPSRYWFQQAVITRDVVFSDVEIDKRTGEMCVTCSMPVYGSDGKLLGVAGADLYLTDMQQAVAESVDNGGYLIVVNQGGHVIVAPEDAGTFRVQNSEEAADLRRSENGELAALVRDALKGKTDVRIIQLDDGNYYMLGVPMKNVGWALISAYSEAEAAQPVELLQANFREIQQEATDAYYHKSAKSNTIVLLILIVLLLLMLAGSVHFGKRIVKPLNTITRRISELNEENLEFRMEPAYRTGDEVEVLAQSFAEISHKTVEYIGQVRQVTAEKERIGTELSLATRIQADMLPNISPAFPERKEFDIFASMDPAKEVGGDFYDFFLVDDDHLCMVIADVSGTGVPAALFMMASKIILDNNAMMGKSPAQILSETNAAICSHNREEMFVTVWLGILELSTGKLTAANAGHEYPVLKKANGDFELVKDKHGLVLGGMEGLSYKEYQLQLDPGDRLFLYTDGVPEATDAKKELFGTERMRASLNKNLSATPEQVLKNVRSAVDAFVGEAEQFDDLTMLCVHYLGPNANRETSGSEDQAPA